MLQKETLAAYFFTFHGKYSIGLICFRILVYHYSKYEDFGFYLFIASRNRGIE